MFREKLRKENGKFRANSATGKQSMLENKTTVFANAFSTVDASGESWIIDSGATEHSVMNRANLCPLLNYQVL